MPWLILGIFWTIFSRVKSWLIVGLLGESSFVACKEVSARGCSLNLLWHQSSDPQGRVDVVNVVSEWVLIFAKLSKGEEEAVPCSYISSTIAFPLQGLFKRCYRARTNARRRIGTQRGLDIVKVSLGFFLSCFKCPSPSVFPHPFRTHCPDAKGDISWYVAPFH